ncbi:MAG TPA: glycosyltransferase [Dermatophilaceae bacterium]|nr:glycosyltransferase [Dermatophilaceae bacterium]
MKRFADGRLGSALPDSLRRTPTVAIAHDYLTTRGGAERVVLAMLRAFPGARIYTTLYDPDATYPEFKDADIVVSKLNGNDFFRRHYRAALPVLPFAAESIEITEDIVIVSSSGWAHGFTATGRKLVYCYTPARWLYQTETYLGGAAWRSPKGVALLAMRPLLRAWDRRHAKTAEAYVGISTVVADRIRETYGVEAPVIFPPRTLPHLDQTPYAPLADWATSGYHLVVSRLLPYKHVDQVVEAFRGMTQRLVIVGHGPLADQIRASLPPNVRLVSNLTDSELAWTYANARTLVAPSNEDFGLTPLEAAAFGKPTVALRGGGYLDTVDEGRTGLFFEAPIAEPIRYAVARATERRWDADAIRSHAESFSEERFSAQLRAAVAGLTVPTGSVSQLPTRSSRTVAQPELIGLAG